MVLVASTCFSVPPEIVLRPFDLDVVTNQRVELECEASGDPYPVITWERNGTQFAGERDVTLEFTVH